MSADLTWEEMRERILHGLAENSARFHPKVLVIEGVSCWATFQSSLIETLHELGWRQNDDHWLPPAAASFQVAYDELRSQLPIVPGMSRENMQPLMEGSYPDADIWLEQFTSYPELQRDDETLVLHPARKTPRQHISFLMERADALWVAGHKSIAVDLADRANEIELENQQTLCPRKPLR
jgi:hypothetical protein